MLMQDLVQHGAIVNMADMYGVTPLLACIDGAVARRVSTDTDPSASSSAQDEASSSASICDSNLATVQVCIQALLLHRAIAHLSFTCLMSKWGQGKKGYMHRTLLCWLVCHMCLLVDLVNNADARYAGLRHQSCFVDSENASDLRMYSHELAVMYISHISGCWFSASRCQCLRQTSGHVQALLQAGAWPDEADDDGMTPLVAACSHADQSDIVLELLKGRADPNLAEAEGQTPLIAAAEEGCWEAVTGLLAAGADVDSTDSEDRTPLMAAAEHGCVECVEMLLHAGADPNHCDEEGTTALMAMALADTYDEDVLQALLSAGADLNTADGDGETALIKAVALVNVDFVEWLLEHGAEADLETDDGQTAVQVARTSCYQSSEDFEKVISMLEAWSVADMLTDSSSTCDDSDSDPACGGASAMVVSAEEDGDKATEADGSVTSEICSVATADLH